MTSLTPVRKRENAWLISNSRQYVGIAFCINGSIFFRTFGDRYFDRQAAVRMIRNVMKRRG